MIMPQLTQRTRQMAIGPWSNALCAILGRSADVAPQRDTQCPYEKLVVEGLAQKSNGAHGERTIAHARLVMCRNENNRAAAAASDEPPLYFQTVQSRHLHVED